MSPEGTRRSPRSLEGTRRSPKVPEGLRRCPKVTRRCPKVSEGTRGHSKVPEGTRRYPKVPEGTRRYPKVPEGTRRYPKVPENPRLCKLRHGVRKVPFETGADPAAQLSAPDLSLEPRQWKRLIRFEHMHRGPRSDPLDHMPPRGRSLPSSAFRYRLP